MKYLKEFMDFEHWDIQEEFPIDINFKIGDYIVVDNHYEPMIWWDSRANKWVKTSEHYSFGGYRKITDIKHSSEILNDSERNNYKIPDTDEYLIKISGKWPWFKLYNIKKQ